MAKLEGVKTLDMENGEITKVEYNGEVYEKVETPKKGDIGWISGYEVYVEILEIDDEGDPVVADEYGRNWYAHTLTYFRKPSAPSLKVGDKVRLISKRPIYGFGGAIVGDVGEIRSIIGEDIAINFPNHSHWNGVISEIEPVESPKVKVGDTIRMVENCPAGGYSTGDTFEVISVDNEYLRFVDNDGFRRNVLVESDTRYEVVPKKQKELFAKVNRPNNVPIPGDYVEFRDDIAEECSSFLTVGKKYFVKGVGAIGDADITDDNGDFESAEPDETKAIYVKYTQEQAEREPEVGDKVLVVNPHRISTDYVEGDILTVRKLNPHNDVKDEGHFYSEEAIVHLNYDEIIVLNPEQVGEATEGEEQPEIKPGDYVFNLHGTLGRVDVISGGFYLGEWLYNEEYPEDFPLEMSTINAIERLATPEEIAEYEAYKAKQNEHVTNPETFEVGDLVQVVDSPSALPNGSYFVVKGVSEDGSILRGVRPNSVFDIDYVYATKHVKLIAKAGKGEGDRFYG